MPKLEPKIVQRELGNQDLWPVYWIYGPEKMKSRELLKRIRTTVLGEASSGGALGGLGFSEEIMDGSEVTAASIADAANSPALGGGTRLVIVKDAHALKNPEDLEGLLQPRVSLAGVEDAARGERLPSVCVFLSKDLDARKKFSKALLEKAAVVPCEEIGESEREAWIDYLAKRKGLALPAEAVLRLTALDPWSLDIVDSELEKASLAQGGDIQDVLQSGTGAGVGPEAFMDAFLSRRLKDALVSIEGFAERTEEALPLLGLLAWNVRHLILLLAEKKSGQRGAVKLNPYAATQLQRWMPAWTLEDALELQSALSLLDYQLKQTPVLPLGAWSSLVTRFCR